MGPGCAYGRTTPLVAIAGHNRNGLRATKLSQTEGELMGIMDEAKGKMEEAKDLLSKGADKAEEAIEKAGDAIDSKT